MHNRFKLGKTIWLNASEQGPLPQAAIDAACLATAQKADPSLLRVSDFGDVPQQLKAVLAQLINAPQPEGIILGNSATYTVRILAEGLPFAPGDEILVEQGDFPTNILSWLPLQEKGVKIVRIKPQNERLGVDDLMRHTSPKTRLLCVSWVNPFNGQAVDVEAVARFCADKGLLFCLNGTQAFGTMPIDVQRLPADAIFGAGYKWLLGPFGTGFGWMRKSLSERLRYNNIHWSAQGTELNDMQSIGNMETASTGNFDVFGTANFLNFMTWTASIKHLLDVGIQNICSHNIGLARHLAENVDLGKYGIISPTARQAPSPIVVLKTRNGNAESIQKSLADNGIYVSLRQGRLRISPHLYNTRRHIDLLLNHLNATT